MNGDDMFFTPDVKNRRNSDVRVVSTFHIPEQHMFSLLIMLAACGEPNKIPALDIEGDNDEIVSGEEVGDDNIVSSELARPIAGANLGVDCDEQDYPMGLTLVMDLPTGSLVKVTALDTEGYVIYQEQVEVDECGYATPFANVSYDDFGRPMDDEPLGVFAQAIGNESYYEYVGALLEDWMEGEPFPISTQWEIHEDDGQWYAERNAEYGVGLGPFMMP
jgi:hypothetical protein